MSAEDENWMNGPIEYFLKNDKKQDIENINVIFEFAISIAARATQIPLNVLTHDIAMRLKARNKKTRDKCLNASLNKVNSSADRTTTSDLQ